MHLFHDSQNAEYRTPFGAVPTGTEITLRLRVSEGRAERVLLRLWSAQRESFVPMECTDERDGTQWFRATVTAPEEARPIWYYFIAESGGRQTYFSNREDELGGAGRQTDFPVYTSYQITVFERDFHTPEWFRHSIMYQIFPDRFFGLHDGDPAEKPRKDCSLHEDWYEPLSFAPHPHENGPACNDFYGGNLAGIRAKLPYLKELGISVLYLNPIFEAYSNHRYDTANYKRIDPMLGTEEDFTLLCREAEQQGIRIILDGVFSHVGADSVYFNKYGTYGEGGAYRDKSSPFASWFDFTDSPPGYASWWGCSNLPNVKEMTPSYLSYILTDSDSVVRRWLRLGASGWRLDVADELPDEFIRLLRQEAKAEKRDAVVIGEVWEDASRKESYGALRSYLAGRELDSVMNYPWKDAVISFLLEQIDAAALNRRLESLRENYPQEVFYSLMNIAGTHDTMRIKSVLGGQDACEGRSTEEKQAARLSPQQETLALQRMRLMVFLQMTYCGVPCIYYGDEIGMQGLGDPFNRMPYTWRQTDPELLAYYRRMTALRRRYTFLRTGEIGTLYAEGDLYLYFRRITGGKDVFGSPAQNGMALCAVNRGAEAKTVRLRVPEGAAELFFDVLQGNAEVRAQNGEITLLLRGRECRMLLRESEVRQSGFAAQTEPPEHPAAP